MSYRINYEAALKIVKEEAEVVFGVSIDDKTAGYILWEETGFPEFWLIPGKTFGLLDSSRPRDGNTPEECLRKQVLDMAPKLNLYLGLFDQNRTLSKPGLPR